MPLPVNKKIINNERGTFWIVNGLIHREDGPAIEYSNGTKEWYINGKRHRLDGPAIEYANGSKLWYPNGMVHREDGPAIETSNGGKSWWINGIFLGSIEELFEKWIENEDDKCLCYVRTTKELFEIEDGL